MGGGASLVSWQRSEGNDETRADAQNDILEASRQVSVVHSALHDAEC